MTPAPNPAPEDDAVPDDPRTGRLFATSDGLTYADALTGDEIVALRRLLAGGGSGPVWTSNTSCGDADPEPPGCVVKELPPELWAEAADRACEINPANRPAAVLLASAAPLDPQHLTLLTGKYWGAKGVRLTVGFVDGAPDDLQRRILAHMKAWGESANVEFVLSRTDPQVRIARENDGYWSYLGTDILTVPKDRPTMNLQGFTMRTSEAEFRRVVRHETGHTLGFSHEHSRREIVQRIDPAKAIAYFGRTQGWSPQTVRDQVLTPLDERSVMGTTDADPTSIMCYALPGAIMRDGVAVPGGEDITPADAAFAAKVYPAAGAVGPPPNPDPGGVIVLNLGPKTITAPAGWKLG